MQHDGDASVSTGISRRLAGLIADRVRAAGGWWPFDAFMAAALYEPGLGYYANAGRKFGLLPQSGSDFVTAPELTPLFGRALAAQVRQVLQAVGSGAVMEFGAGSGALAESLLDALGDVVADYAIVDLSGTLRERQQARLARFGGRVRWLDALPARFDGVVVGNEVLDAMPVQLIAWDGRRWRERGVVLAEPAADGTPRFDWALASDRPEGSPADAAGLAPPVDMPFLPGTVTELPTQAKAFVRTLAGMLGHGAALFIDYGFPEAEYYHPQRQAGTLVCHRGHRTETADRAPLEDPGLKDITAHVDFTAIALAAQDAGLDVAGYTSQARFLANCGLIDLLADAPLAERAMAQKLLAEHEMGELFKVIALTRGELPPLLGFAAGDRTHRL